MLLAGTCFWLIVVCCLEALIYPKPAETLLLFIPKPRTLSPKSTFAEFELYGLYVAVRVFWNDGKVQELEGCFGGGGF